MHTYTYKDLDLFEACMYELSKMDDIADIAALARDPRGYMHARLVDHFKVLAHEYNMLKETVRIFASRNLKKCIWAAYGDRCSLSNLITNVKQHIYGEEFDYSKAQTVLLELALCIMELHTLVNDVSGDMCDVSNAMFLIVCPSAYFESQRDETDCALMQ